MRFCLRIRAVTILAGLALLTTVHSGAGWAQSGTSSALAGTVADATGAVIPGARVKATDVNTGAVREGRSDGDGR